MTAIYIIFKTDYMPDGLNGLLGAPNKIDLTQWKEVNATALLGIGAFADPEAAQVICRQLHSEQATELQKSFNYWRKDVYEHNNKLREEYNNNFASTTDASSLDPAAWNLATQLPFYKTVSLFQHHIDTQLPFSVYSVVEISLTP